MSGNTLVIITNTEGKTYSCEISDENINENVKKCFEILKNNPLLYFDSFQSAHVGKVRAEESKLIFSFLVSIGGEEKISFIPSETMDSKFFEYSASFSHLKNSASTECPYRPQNTIQTVYISTIID